MILWELSYRAEPFLPKCIKLYKQQKITGYNHSQLSVGFIICWQSHAVYICLLIHYVQNILLYQHWVHKVINFQWSSFLKCLLMTSLKGFLVPFTEKSWNYSIYKCSVPGLWAINTPLCCIRTATSSKLCFYSELLSVHQANLPHWDCLHPLCSKEQEAIRMLVNRV